MCCLKDAVVYHIWRYHCEENLLYKVSGVREENFSRLLASHAVFALFCFILFYHLIEILKMNFIKW